MKLIIAGGRDVTKQEFNQAMFWFQSITMGVVITEVVSGACPTGADHWGEEWAKARGIPVKPFPADWEKHGKSAGPKRNRQMAEYGDRLLSIWDGKSPGTKNMNYEMKRAGKIANIWFVSARA